MDSNLPMKVDNKQELIESKRNRHRMIRSLKKTGKIGRDFLIAGGGIIIAVAGTVIALPAVGAAVTALGFGTYITSFTRAIYYSIHKKDNDMMFVLRKKINGDNAIFQDILDLKAISLMKGYEPSEKAALMGLQNLVGLQRYKQKLADKNAMKQISKDGTNFVYDSIFSTITHSVNIKTFQALEALGYIQIESVKDKGSKMLFLERMEFGQFKEAKEALKAKITNNEELKQQYLKQMQEIRFKLTDKPLDLESLYKQYIEAGSRGERDLKRLGIIIRALREKNIDIETDDLGISRINYRAKTSLAKRIDEEIRIKREKKTFKEELMKEAEQSVVTDRKIPQQMKENNDREIND